MRLSSSNSKSNFVVRVADYNLRRKELRPQQAMTVAIEKLVVHPHYRKDRKYDNDIALVRCSFPEDPWKKSIHQINLIEI